MVNLVKLVMNGLLELLFIQQSAVTYHSFRSHVISLSLYILFGTLVALIRFIILFFLYYFLILVDLFQAKSRLLFFLSFFKHNYYKIYITLAQSCNFLNILNRFPKRNLSTSFVRYFKVVFNYRLKDKYIFVRFKE